MKNVCTIVLCLFSLLLQAQSEPILPILMKAVGTLTPEEKNYLKTIEEIDIPNKLKEFPASLNNSNCPNLLKLSLRLSKDFKALPTAILELEKLEELKLFTSRIKQLDLSTLKNLRHLKIEGWELTHLLLGKKQADQFLFLATYCNKLKSLKIDDQESIKSNHLDLSFFKNIHQLNIYHDNLVGITLAGAQFKTLTTVNIGSYKLKSFKVIAQDQIQSSPLTSFMLTQSMSLKANLSFLERCTNLEDLFIYGPATIFLKDFSKLTKLKSLAIESTDLTVFPSGISNIIGLEELRVRAPITKVPESLANLQKLEYLVLKSKYLTEFPLALVECTTLTELHITAPITKVPESLANLQKLERLFIRDKYSLSAFPPAITELKKLRDLEIDGTFAEIPKTITDLKNLQKIELKSKQMATFPSQLIQMEGLNKITISAPITEIPESIKTGQDLKLYLFDTKIKEVENSILSTFLFLKIKGHQISAARVKEIKLLMGRKVELD